MEATLSGWSEASQWWDLKRGTLTCQTSILDGKCIENIQNPVGTGE